MSERRRDGFSEAIVGLFMLAVLAVLVYFTVIISGVDVFSGRDAVEATVLFSDLGGLKAHDNVEYRGGKVGTVERIELSPEGYKVSLKIDRNVILCEGYRITVCNSSVLGGHHVKLVKGTGRELSLTETEFVGEPPVDAMEEVVEIARKVNDLVSDPRLTNIVANADATLADVAGVVGSVRAGRGTVGRLLSPDDTVYVGLETTVTNLAAVTSTVCEGKGTIGRLLSEDDTVYRDLQRTLDATATVAERLKNGEGLVGRLLAKDDPILQELEASVKAFHVAADSMDMTKTVESANRLLTSLNVVGDRLAQGEGTVGRLLADDELYTEVRGLTKDVRQVLDNFRDTTPISTFGSLIMGGL